jgi:hypothetical protein
MAGSVQRKAKTITKANKAAGSGLYFVFVIRLVDAFAPQRVEDAPLEENACPPLGRINLCDDWPPQQLRHYLRPIIKDCVHQAVAIVLRRCISDL